MPTIERKRLVGVLISVCVGLPAGFAVTTAAFATGDSTSGPNYPVNASRQTYGSSALARTPAEEPDLIAVEMANGVTGYVYREALAKASGDWVKTPDRARAEMAAPDYNKPKTLRAYVSDGKTFIGTWTFG